MNLLTVSKLKIYILASENEKSIKISDYQCDVGVKFEQAAREKLSNEKNQFTDAQVQLATSLRSHLPEKVVTRNVCLTMPTKNKIIKADQCLGTQKRRKQYDM